MQIFTGGCWPHKELTHKSHFQLHPYIHSCIHLPTNPSKYKWFHPHWLIAVTLQDQWNLLCHPSPPLRGCDRWRLGSTHKRCQNEQHIVPKNILFCCGCVGLLDIGLNWCCRCVCIRRLTRWSQVQTAAIAGCYQYWSNSFKQLLTPLQQKVQIKLTQVRALVHVGLRVSEVATSNCGSALRGSGWEWRCWGGATSRKGWSQTCHSGPAHVQVTAEDAPCL